MKTALYIRTSTEIQINGLDSQKQALENYCKISSIQDYEVYSDFGHSGSKESRPELDRMLTDCRLGLVTSVIVYSFSRFARSTKHLILALEEFDSLNIKFISLTENLNTSTPLGRTIFQIIASISELERELIRERVRNGLKAARARGTRLGAVKKYTNCEVFKQLSRSGLTVREIAKTLNCSTSTVIRALKEMNQKAG